MFLFAVLWPVTAASEIFFVLSDAVDAGTEMQLNMKTFVGLRVLQTTTNIKPVTTSMTADALALIEASCKTSKNNGEVVLTTTTITDHSYITSPTSVSAIKTHTWNL